MPIEVYPEHFNDTDKSIYDDLINRGETLIGKKLTEHDRFLIQLSAKITINQMKGVKSGFSDEEIEDMKHMHKEMANRGVIETPPDKFYDGLIELSDCTTFENPLNKPAEHYYELSRTNPDEDDVILENDADNYIAEQMNKLEIPVNID